MFVLSMNNIARQEFLKSSHKISRMDIQNTQSQMRKGVLEFCILSIIKQGEVYPSDIVERMKAANLHILEGTLYPFINTIKKRRLCSLIAG